VNELIGNRQASKIKTFNLVKKTAKKLVVVPGGITDFHVMFQKTEDFANNEIALFRPVPVSS